MGLPCVLWVTMLPWSQSREAKLLWNASCRMLKHVVELCSTPQRCCGSSGIRRRSPANGCRGGTNSSEQKTLRGGQADNILSGQIPWDKQPTSLDRRCMHLSRTGGSPQRPLTVSLGPSSRQKVMVNMASSSKNSVVKASHQRLSHS